MEISFSSFVVNLIDISWIFLAASITEMYMEIS